ncbi:MAG: hypothetical protein Q7V20_21765 [Aquabacterium sp.]|uniref:hypothetical protein n=1 Tax=Aquabacterium sp. TaxID=1872578 RepID=UPI00271D089B|nr:hypothetical protein [Aquabacterium sp.]MDO9006080.1 hypothetical protein [Aquabacterium sp.]
MSWAVRVSAGRQAVHISMLNPKENGAACGCLCFACGDKLRAINVGKPATHFEKAGTQRPHFKHDHGGADRKCLSAVARLIALAHFIEQDVIVLPPRSYRVTRLLASGKTIEVVKESPGVTEKVVERRWVDDQSAILLLADGRELAVTVRTAHSLGPDGVSRSVLSFAGVTNPDVAGWSKEQILAQLLLPGWMKWDRHWDDEQLDESAQGQLASDEDQLLSDIPREWLEGLSGKMASETILHWVIKRAIERHKTLKLPEFSVIRTQTMPDGTVARETAKFAQQTLLIDRVTFERKVGDMVPDAVCWASRMGSNDPPFQLLIEAAVTHYVDDEKRQKILQSGIACIQIRADLFSQAGAVPVANIERMVCSDAAGKEWIKPPDLTTEIAQADRRLSARARTIQKQVDDEKRREEQRVRNQAKLDKWYRDAPDQELAERYLKELCAVWLGHKPPAMFTIEVDMNCVWQSLTGRGMARGSRIEVESKSGLLYLLWRIQDLPSLPGHTEQAIEMACAAAQPGWSGSAPKAVLAMYALRAYHGGKLRASSDLYRDTVDQISRSLKAGESTYVRDVNLDPLLRLLFPEISADLSKSVATPAAVREVLAQRIAAEEQAREVKARRARRNRAVADGRAAQAAAKLRSGLDAEIALCVSKARWMRSQLGPQDAARLYGLFGGKVSFHGLDTMTVIKSALEFKALGRSIKLLLEGLAFTHPNDVRKALKLLHHASICVVVDDSLISNA